MRPRSMGMRTDVDRNDHGNQERRCHHRELHYPGDGSQCRRDVHHYPGRSRLHPTTLGNYSITLVNRTLTVTKATLMVTADNKTKILDAVNPTSHHASSLQRQMSQGSFLPTAAPDCNILA